MEVFNANLCTEEAIDLKSASQLESFLSSVKEGKDIMVKWKDKDDNKKSKILLTENLLSRISDGRLSLTSTETEED